jgi:hypothetical protein
MLERVDSATLFLSLVLISLIGRRRPFYSKNPASLDLYDQVLPPKLWSIVEKVRQP